MPNTQSADLATYLLSLPPDLLPRSYQRLFTPRLTLFCLLHQRLQGGSCQQTLADLHLGGADALGRPGQPPPSQKILSHNTSALCQARGRLPLDCLDQCLRWQANGQGRSPDYWNKPIRLLDGSTLALRPLGDTAKKLPPHSTRKNQGYWCLLRVVVAFCLQTGLALQCAMGSKHESEQALALQLLKETSAAALYLGDRNFGVLSVVQALVASQADALLRLTDVRARKLLGRAPRAGTDTSIFWSPSARDQRVQPHVVPGRLLCVRVQRKGFRTLTLCLFTTLTNPKLYPAAQLAQLYGWRWQVEINLRHLKTRMKLGVLEAHSAEMNQKEWLAGLLAYNFLRGIMTQAAPDRRRPPRTLSFSLALSLCRLWLGPPARSQSTAAPTFPRLLRLLAQVQPPKRSSPRPSQLRKVRYLARSFPALRGNRSSSNHPPKS